MQSVRLRYRRSLASIMLVLAVFCCHIVPVLAVPIEPSRLEQYMLELINRARANPTAEAARFDIDLNEGLPSGTISSTPKQPLAFNLFLNDSAEDHSQWLIDQDVFQHEGPGGNHPSNRAANAGYALTAPWGVGENLGWQGMTSSIPDPYSTTTQLHQGLFVDEGISDRGHRTNMLAEDFKEAGVGIVAGVFEQTGRNYNALMITDDFTYRAGNAFITGVVYQDNDNNSFYTPDGEGYGGINVRAVSTTTGATFETTGFASGGYSLQVPADTYNVTLGGGDLLDTTFLDIVVGTKNVKIDAVDSAALRPWSNPFDQFDSDINGEREPHDILVLVDDINRNGARSLASPPSLVPPVYLDANRDAWFTPNDILQVIDAVNRAFGSNLTGGETSGSVLSFVEGSDFISTPEPTAAILGLMGIISLLAFSRRRGKLSR